MKYHTDDVRITGMEEVLPPEALLADLPISDVASRFVYTERRELSDIIHGRDPRLMVVIGPCSIHDPAAALEYAGRLSEQIARYRDTLKIVDRAYILHEGRVLMEGAPDEIVADADVRRVYLGERFSL